MYLTGKYFLGSLCEDNECFDIREEVFCKEQGLPDSFRKDENDALSIFAVAYEEGADFKTPVACGRLEFVDDYFLINRIATLKEFRNKGYGDFVVRMLIDKAYTMGAEEIFVNSALPAVNFYKKIGFAEYGPVYSDPVRGELQPMSVKPCNCKRLCCS